MSKEVISRSRQDFLRKEKVLGMTVAGDNLYEFFIFRQCLTEFTTIFLNVQLTVKIVCARGVQCVALVYVCVMNQLSQAN